MQEQATTTDYSNYTSVLEFLSFEAGTMTSNNTSSSSRQHQQQPMHMQGVLWKRRDIFKNKWRPRWFVLHPEQRVLTYYLLTNQAGIGPQQVVSSSRSSSNSTPSRSNSSTITPNRTPSRRNSNNSTSRIPSSSSSIGSSSNYSNNNNRRRTFSESSTLSTNTIDCDVVPRGTIYLLGSTVEANELLTRPDEDLYTLSITEHETGTSVHLAARTEDDRDQWIIHIARVCRRDQDAGSGHDEEQRSSLSSSQRRASYTGVASPSRSISSTKATPRTPMSSNTISDRMMTTPTASGSAATTRNEVVGENKCSSNLLQDFDRNHNAQNFETNIQRIDSNKLTTSSPAKRIKKYPYQVAPSFEKEMLILCGPLILYKLLLMMSFQFSALCFVAAIIIASRWVILKNISSIMRILPDDDKIKQSNRTTKSIGHGSTCCRFTVDLTKALRFLADKKDTMISSKSGGTSASSSSTGNEEIFLSHILVKALATAMSQHPHLISRKYPLLPRVYSVDVAHIDLKSADTVVWVNKADERSVEEIANFFFKSSEKEVSSLPSTFWQDTIGPTCRVVMTTPDFEYSPVDVDLNLTDCPIAIFISGTTQLLGNNEEKQTQRQHQHQQKLNISINIQSTDVNACRKFADNVQKCIQQFPNKVE
jgi:hypothetical protein